MHQNFLLNGVNLTISNNTFKNINLDEVYIDRGSFTNGAVKLQNNKLINVNTSNSFSGITIKNVQNVAISGNQIFKTQLSKVPVAAFSASPTSGYAPQTIKFTDKSTGSLTSWKWDFGDRDIFNSKEPFTYIQ